MRIQKLNQCSEINANTKGIGDPAAWPWNLLSEDVSLPAAIVYQAKLEGNLRWMQEFVESQGVALAPHGKTTLTPAFFDKQIAAGAWGITLATATQVAAASDQGIKRILMANQLVGRRNMEIIAALPEQLDFYCLVDSADNIHQLGTFFGQANRDLNILIEVGVEQGRCGCREDTQVIELSRIVAQYDCLKLVGVEVYEGIIHGKGAEDKIHKLLSRVVALTERLIEFNAFDVDQIILTGAGSAWYDLVSNYFKRISQTNNILPLIRPGCYLIHDKGIYEEAQNDVICRLEKTSPDGSLESCLEIWAYVQSIPEPGRAIIGMGKRDVAFSDGLPQPALHYRPGNQAPAVADPAWKIMDIQDQHAYLHIPSSSDIKVGDIVSFSTSHPCLTFDKWKHICVIDDGYNVIDCVSTCF